MKISEFENFPLPRFYRGATAKKTIFSWDDTQGSAVGIRSLGFRCGSPNNEADELGLNKSGRSRRGVKPCFRPVDNSKKRGIKSLSKKSKRFSIRFLDN